FPIVSTTLPPEGPPPPPPPHAAASNVSPASRASLLQPLLIPDPPSLGPSTLAAPSAAPSGCGRDPTLASRIAPSPPTPPSTTSRDSAEPRPARLPRRARPRIACTRPDTPRPGRGRWPNTRRGPPCTPD